EVDRGGSGEVGFVLLPIAVDIPAEQRGVVRREVHAALGPDAGPVRPSGGARGILCRAVVVPALYCRTDVHRPLAVGLHQEQVQARVTGGASEGLENGGLRVGGRSRAENRRDRGYTAEHELPPSPFFLTILATAWRVTPSSSAMVL